MNQNGKDIQDLRTQFLSKLESSDSDLFHPADINKVKTNDNYLKRFLLHHDGNFDNAFNMLWETCEWRKKFGANDITENSVNKEILELGSVFSYGKDKDSKTLLIFKSKKHFKASYDFEDQKKCLVYWMERLERQCNGDMISLFFDMDGAGLSNMDMDYTKYVISLFKNYYPHFLNYIIIFEMAWVLNAVFKVIKTLLPAKAVDKMKFVTKSNVKDYIDSEFLLKSWGGKDPYVFQFEPEQQKNVLPVLSSSEDNRKKVHFADGFKPDQSSDTGLDDSNASESSIKSHNLQITPSNVLVFSQESNEISSLITLTNKESSLSISYKIKTTSPEKFRVRPSSGALAPGSCTSISVILLPGYHLQSLQKDKFLIMSILINNAEVSQPEITDLWKQADEKDITLHKLRCSVSLSNDTILKNGSALTLQSTNEAKDGIKLSTDVNKINSYIGSLKEELKTIKFQMRMILFTLITLLFSVFIGIYIIFNNTSQLKSCWADHGNSL